MPNWCEQDLTVSTPDQDNWKSFIPELKRFKNHAEGTTRYGDKQVLYDGHFIPYPLKYAIQDAKVKAIDKYRSEKFMSAGGQNMSDEERTQWNKDNPFNREKDGFNQGGYNWCVQNYGSKWGISKSELTNDDSEWGTLEYSFQSAWSPVKPLILKMSQLFPNLVFTLRYFERGMAFHGIYEVKNGEVKEEEETKYYGNRGG